MNINFGKPVSLSQFQQSVNMGDVAVYTAVGYQTEHMQRGIVLLAVLNCCHQLLILEEIAILDRLGDAGQLLVYDAACTHI